MKPLHLAIMGIILSFVMWGSLFFTVITQSTQTHQLLKNDNTLLSQQRQTLASIQSNATIRTQQINSLQSHIDCLFNLATQPNRSSTYIKDATNCTLSSTALPSPTASPAKTFTPVTTQNTPTPAQQGSGTAAQTKSEQPAPTPQPSPQPSVVKRVENFLGLPNLKFQ